MIDITTPFTGELFTLEGVLDDLSRCTIAVCASPDPLVMMAATLPQGGPFIAYRIAPHGDILPQGQTHNGSSASH